MHLLDDVELLSRIDHLPVLRLELDLAGVYDVAGRLQVVVGRRVGQVRRHDHRKRLLDFEDA